MSIAKPSKVIHRESKSPSEFCERLCEAYRLYSQQTQPEAAGSAAFVFLAYPENVR